MLEVAAASGADAGGLGALPVPDLDQVPEQGAGPVPGRLVPVVAVVDRDGDQRDGVVPSAGGQAPGAVPALRRGSVIIGLGEGERRSVAGAMVRGAAAVPGGCVAAGP